MQHGWAWFGKSKKSVEANKLIRSQVVKMANKPEITRFIIGNWSIWKYKITMLLKGISKTLDVLDGRYSTPVAKPIREKASTPGKAGDIAIEEFQELESYLTVTEMT